MSSLAHHGVKGQKWGVRRYQNPDGTRTALGKKHYSVEAANVESTRKDIKNLVKKFSKKDKEMFFDRHFWNESYDKSDTQVAKRFVIKEGRDIVAFIDAQTSRYDSDLNMVIGTAQCARGKGYASVLSKKMVDWYESEGYKDYGQLEWNAYNENVGSRKAAEKAGFKQVNGDYEESNYLYDKKAKKELDKLSSAFNKKNAVESEVEERINSDFEKTWMGKFSPITRFHTDGRTYWDIDNPHYNSQGRTKANLIDSYAERWAKKKHGQDIKEYTETANDFTRAYAEYNKKRNKVKHSSIGGNMNYIYGNTLVLGDSSYLEHHGIKNQKWGVRRFQNPDGSLTAAGRIRYGVTGAAKAAFKVGKKLGAATASAARAGVKKAKDNAYAKKKEKASQTREGVLKNKKMFTNEELERLEKRFKIEDDMRNAGLRHGQEIAKTISAYSDAAVKTMNALQTGGKAVKAISDGLSALQDYKEKRDIGKKASDAGMSTADYKEYTKAKTSEKTSNKPPNDDNPPNDGGGGGSKKQAEYAANRQKAQEAIYAKRKADLDSRESGAKQREDYLNKRQDALVKISKQRQSEQDARDADLNRRDKSASEREAKLRETAKAAADVMSVLNKRKADLDKKEEFLNSAESYRLDTLSEFKKNEEAAARRKKKNAKHSAIGEEMYADYLSEIYDPDYLEHFGVRGMKWGVRRYQNPDGTLTEKGKKRYANPDGSLNAKGRKIDAKRITKQLNANDKASAWAVRRREDSREMAERNETRAEKARSKGKLERAEKFDTLAKKQRDEQKIQNKKYLDLEEKNGKLVAEAIAKDYDVRQTPTMRDVTNGKEHVANIALELAATMAGLPFTYKTGKEVLGTDYRVKAKKASKNGQVVLSPAGMAVAAVSKKKAKHDAFEIQNGVLMYGYNTSDELEHFGLKGMKWGVRRFQNKDGSLTEAGKQRYANTGNLDSGGGGGGAPEEEDEETKKAIEEAAKKAGMTVDEYRKKFADKVAALKEKARDAAWDARYAAEDAADAVTGKTSKEIAEKSAKSAKENEEKAKAARKEGRYEDAAKYEEWAKQSREISEYRQKKYDDSLAQRTKQALNKASDAKNAAGKFLNDIGSDKVSKSFSQQSYESSRRNATRAEDYKRKAASAANAGDKYTADKYNKQAARFEMVSKQQGEHAKKWGDLYSESTVKGRVKSAANAAKNASKKVANVASDAKYEVGYHAENALDAVTGQRSKKQAKAWTETARYHEKQAERAKAKYISGTRNPDSFEGKMRNSNNAVAAKNQKKAKEAQETANAWTNSYKRSLAGRAEAASKKIGAKAQEAKDKLKARTPKRSIALEVANTGPAPLTSSQIHTADMYNKYFGAVARARKTAANSTAAQRAKYGDRRNIRERAEAEELNNLRAKEKRDEAIRLRMAKKFDKKADSARAHGNKAKAEAFEKESNRQFNKAPWSGSKAEAFEAARDAKLASHLVRNAATAKRAQSATLAENRNRNAAHLAERRREKAINDAKAKIRSGELPTHELTRYAKSSVGQLKSAAKAELARREKEQALASMGSDYARATARVTTTSSTTNMADAHNEKLARDRRERRKQAANVSATAKKNRLAGSGRKKYTSGQTSSIGRVGSGRGKTSTRR